jgi:hypothetical protein
MKNLPCLIEEAYERWLVRLFDVFFESSIDEWAPAWQHLLNGLAHAKRCRNALCGLGDQLVLVFKETKDMATAQKFKLAPAAKGKGAVMPSVNWSTLSAGIAFQVVDANGIPVGTIDPTTVTTTLAVQDGSGNPSTLASVTAGADALNYTVTRAAGALGNITLVATLTYNTGSPGPFGASLPIVLNPPAPGAPADLALVISGN